MTYSAASLRWAAEQADRPHWARDHEQAMTQVAAVSHRRQSRDIDSRMPDRDVCKLAEHRAELMTRELFELTEPMGVLQSVDFLNARVVELGGRPFGWAGDAPSPQDLSGMWARAQCRLWWRRQLRRAVVRAREAEGIAAGRVCSRHEPYCTDDTVQRRQERAAANAAMLEATWIESADGEQITLAQAAASSTASKPIRRGELMTRIRGCEEWAEAAGLVGIFTTNTLPSRFHRMLWTGGQNPRADGTDGPMQPNGPRDGQSRRPKPSPRNQSIPPSPARSRP